MKKILFFISIILTLLLDSNLAAVFGLSENRLTASILFLFLFLLYELLTDNIKCRQLNRPEIMLIIMGFVIIIAIAYIQRIILLKLCISFLFIPYTLSIYLSSKKRQYESILRLIIYIILCLEIVMVIYERATQSVLLASEDQYSYINTYGDSWSFRASGLYGHPLTSAMILSVANIFILCSDLNIKVKAFFFCSILIGLLCLNERGNILITLVCSLPFIFNSLNKQVGINKIIGYFIIFLICCYAYQSLSKSDFGGRLFHYEMSFSDGSSQQRLEAFKALSYMDKDVLLWGLGDNQVKDIKDLTYVENGFICILLQYGLVLGIPLILLLMFFLYMKLKVFRWQHAFLIALVFIGIGLTNPQLSNPLQWIFWIVAYYAFCPSTKNTIISNFLMFPKRKNL